MCTCGECATPCGKTRFFAVSCCKHIKPVWYYAAKNASCRKCAMDSRFLPQELAASWGSSQSVTFTSTSQWREALFSVVNFHTTSRWRYIDVTVMLLRKAAEKKCILLQAGSTQAARQYLLYDVIRNHKFQYVSSHTMTSFLSGRGYVRSVISRLHLYGAFQNGHYSRLGHFIICSLRIWKCLPFKGVEGFH
jgi:hypothetical protein